MLSDIYDLYGAYLAREDGSATISVKALKFLVKEAEKLQAIREEANDLYAEKIDYMDFGERVDNIL